MTVPATARRAGPFTGNGVTTSFPFTFKVFAAADVEVTFTSSTGIESVLTGGYTVTLNADQDASPGGTVTYPTSGALLAGGESLTLVGALDYDQTLDLPGGGSFSPRAVENALDRATMQIQQLAEVADRTLTLPVSADGVSAQLPVPEAGSFLGWDATGTALRNVDPSTAASIVAYANWRTEVFDGAAASYALAVDPGSANNCDVSVSGVSQTPGVDFTVSGTTLTPTTAWPAGTDTVVVRYGEALPQGTMDADATSYTPGGTGAITESVRTHLRRTIWLDSFNSVEEALVYCMSLGGKGRGVRATGGKRYTRTGRLLMGIYPGCGIYCLEGTAELYFPAASFTNSTLSNKYAASSAGIDISGELSGGFARAEGQFLIGLHITSEVADGRMIDAVTARNTRNLRLEGLTFSGFPVGCDIRASTWDGGRIDNCRHLGRASTHVWPSQPQSTAIEFDNDRVNATASTDVQIINPWGQDFTITGQSTSAWDDQTDFININHHESAYFTITSPTARNFGEGIDIFGKHIDVTNPSLNQMKTYALKFVNGAKFCSVSGGGAEDVGLAGVVFAGSPSAGVGDTTRNTVTGFNVTNVDYQNRFSGGEGCVSFIDNVGTAGKPIGNIVTGGRYSLGAYGKYGVHDQSTGSGNVVQGFDVTMNAVSGAAVALIVNGGTVVEPATKTMIRVFRSSTQAIATATRTLLIHDSTNIDRRDEHNTTTGLATMQYPGPKRVSGTVRFAGLGAAGIAVKMYIERNGSDVKVLDFWSTGASDESFTIEDVVDCVAGQTLGVAVYQASGSTRNTTAGSQYTCMTIEAV